MATQRRKKRIVKDSAIVPAQGKNEMASERTTDTGSSISDIGISRRLPSVTMAGPSIASYRLPTGTVEHPVRDPKFTIPRRPGSRTPAGGNIVDIADLAMDFIQSTIRGTNDLLDAVTGKLSSHDDYYSMHNEYSEQHPCCEDSLHHCHSCHESMRCDKCYTHSRCGSVYGC